MTRKKRAKAKPGPKPKKWKWRKKTPFVTNIPTHLLKHGCKSIERLARDDYWELSEHNRAYPPIYLDAKPRPGKVHEYTIVANPLSSCSQGLLQQALQCMWTAH